MPRTVRGVDEPVEPAPSTTNPAPFVIAFVIVSILVVVSFLFFREGDEEQGQFPDEVDAVDDDTVRAVAVLEGCRVLDRAQVDYDDEQVYVELVSVPADAAGCETFPEREIVAEIELPRPIEDRDVVPGYGRFQLPCSDGRCAEDG